ncbi:hypothetical protein CSKR_108992 [Clonorchis sinensis]|uniref:Uncharacterized protein n=1 Tax=Clonorchis sinensis TaxID=79923 RepID=A0A3R7EV62_CLOSI|nr:hypothetical protein CSKR_108992 [Clonorchis sinensis]
MTSCHATQRKHEGWDTARLPKPRQGKSRGRGRVRTTDLPSFSTSNDNPEVFTLLVHEVPDQKVCGSNPTSAYRLLLSRLRRTDNISAFVLPWGDTLARHRKGVTPERLTIEQGSKTLIRISFTKLNIHLLLERVFLNFSGYSLTVTQIQANATKRLRQFRNRSHFSRDAERIYEKTYYSRASSVVSTITACLGNLALSQPSYNLPVAWQLGTERVLQLNDFFKSKRAGNCVNP